MRRPLSTLFLSALAVSTALICSTAQFPEGSKDDTNHLMNPNGQVAWGGGKILDNNALTAVQSKQSHFQARSGSGLNGNELLVCHGTDYIDRNDFSYDRSPSTQTENNSNERSSPWLNDKGDLVWQEWDGQDYEVFLLDDTTIIQITNNAYDDVNPQINERGCVAWRQFDGEDYEIFFYDGSTIKQITNNSYNENGLQLNEKGHMVWYGEPDGADREIFFYDGSTVIQLTHNSISEDLPKINANGNVVWYARGEIFLYDGSRIREIRKASGSRGDPSPDMSANRDIIWREYDRKGGEIYDYVRSTTPATIRLRDKFFDDRDPLPVWKGFWTGEDDKIFLAISLSLADTQETASNERGKNVTEGSLEDKGKVLQEKSRYHQIEWHILDKVASSILKYSRKHRVDPALVLAIMKAESDFNHSSISRKGAIGLMQIMPKTAYQMRINPFDIEENIEGGIKHLSFLLKKFGSIELAVAAYNAGSVNVKKHKDVPPFKETKRYVRKVLAYYRGKV